MKIVIRKDLERDSIPDSRDEYRTWYTRQDVDGREMLYQHPETGDVVILLNDLTMAVLYSVDLDFEER